MTRKTKTFCLIIGLVVCLLIVLITQAEARRARTESENKIDQPAAMTHAVVSTGTQWLIRTTCKLLTPINNN